MFEQYNDKFKIELNEGFHPYLIHKINDTTLTSNVMTVSEAFEKANGNGALFCTELWSLEAAKLLKKLYDTVGAEIEDPKIVAILNFNRTTPIEYNGKDDSKKEVIKTANTYLKLIDNNWEDEVDVAGSAKDFVDYVYSKVEEAQKY